jgi:hypothetical protein
MMQRWIKRSLVVFMAVTIVFTATGVSALAGGGIMLDEPSGESMIADFLLLRPLGIAATGVGSVFFVVSLPFSWPTGSLDAAFDKLVVEPASFTFARPLGKVD